MRDFFNTRPLSVLASFVTCGCSALGAAVSWLNLQSAWRAAVEIDPGVARGVAVPMFLSTAAVVVPMVSMAALYRDSRLGMRVTTAGCIALMMVSLAMNVFPLDGVLEFGLIAWMAYELDGFNVLTWIEARLRRTQPAKDSFSKR